MFVVFGFFLDVVYHMSLDARYNNCKFEVYSGLHYFILYIFVFLLIHTLTNPVKYGANSPQVTAH